MNPTRPAYFVDGDETVQDIDPGACRLCSLHIVNGDAAVRYVQLFDAAADDVTLGTTAPTMVVPVAASGTLHLNFTSPVRFDTALSFAVTTTATGSTAPTADAFVGATVA